MVHRSFRASAGALAACVGLAAPTHGHAQAVFDLRELAPDIYAAIVRADPPAYAFANSLVVIGSNGVLVVDTQQSLTAARSLISEIRSRTDVPVRWVVNTHWHGDHVNGNQEYAAAFPGVEFISHASVPHDLATVATARRAEELETLPASIRERERWLEEGRSADGAPLEPETRRAVERSARLRRSYLADLERTRSVPPSLTVIDSLDLQVGRHRVRLLHVGPAHTSGDLIVVVQTAGVAAVGDLLEIGMPYFADASPSGWQRAIDRIAVLHARVLFPAHGSVQHDDSLVRDMRALLAQVARTADCRSRQSPESGQRCMSAPAVAVLEARWKEQYRVGSAAFRSGFDTAVQRALLERTVR